MKLPGFLSLATAILVGIALASPLSDGNTISASNSLVGQEAACLPDKAGCDWSKPEQCCSGNCAFIGEAVDQCMPKDFGVPAASVRSVEKRECLPDWSACEWNHPEKCCSGKCDIGETVNQCIPELGSSQLLNPQSQTSSESLANRSPDPLVTDEMITPCIADEDIGCETHADCCNSKAICLVAGSSSSGVTFCTTGVFVNDEGKTEYLTIKGCKPHGWSCSTDEDCCKDVCERTCMTKEERDEMNKCSKNGHICNWDSDCCSGYCRGGDNPLCADA